MTVLSPSNNEINADTSENPGVVVRELVRKGKLK